MESVVGARLLSCSTAEYHADPCPTPSLSASLAHTIVSKSPAHAWLQHPRLGGVPNEPTKATDKGTLVHALLLGDGPPISVIVADNYRTKDAQEARDQAYETGAIPVLEREVDEAVTVVRAIGWRLDDLGIVLSGQSELKLAWDYTTDSGAVVACRSMVDHLRVDEAVVYDLKTARSAQPAACGRSSAEHGYPIQAACYTHAVGCLVPDLVGRVRCEFIFAETEPPFAVTVARPDGMMMDLGYAQWERAAQTWADCLRTNVWPGYADRVVPLSVPAWALQEEALINGGFIP